MIGPRQHHAVLGPVVLLLREKQARGQPANMEKHRPENLNENLSIPNLIDVKETVPQLDSRKCVQKIRSNFMQYLGMLVPNRLVQSTCTQKRKLE